MGPDKSLEEKPFYIRDLLGPEFRAKTNWRGCAGSPADSPCVKSLSNEVSLRSQSNILVLFPTNSLWEKRKSAPKVS